MKNNPITKICLFVIFGMMFLFILLYFLDCKDYEQSQPKPVISLQTIDKKINENTKQIDSIRAMLDTLSVRESYRELQERYPGHVDGTGTKANRKDATSD